MLVLMKGTNSQEYIQNTQIWWRYYFAPTRSGRYRVNQPKKGVHVAETRSSWTLNPTVWFVRNVIINVLFSGYNFFAMLLDFPISILGQLPIVIPWNSPMTKKELDWPQDNNNTWPVVHYRLKEATLLCNIYERLMFDRLYGRWLGLLDSCLTGTTLDCPRPSWWIYRWMRSHRTVLDFVTAMKPKREGTPELHKLFKFTN